MNLENRYGYCFPLEKGGMRRIAPRVPGTAQLRGFLLIALWTLLFSGGLPGRKAVAAFRLFRGITFAEFKVQVLQSAECSVHLVMWQLPGAAAAPSHRTQSHGPSLVALHWSFW